MQYNSFTQQDYLLAKEAFCQWQGKASETVEDYILRKRKAELANLVKKVIKNELSLTDRMIVELHWYEGLSKSEIADRLNLDRSTVSRRTEKINDIIYEKLKYAIEYRYGKSFSSKAQLIIKNKEAAYTYNDPKNISQRIKNLRTGQYLSIGDISEMTGISEKRLKEIEKSGENLTAKELRKFAVCFHTSSDYLLFGKNSSDAKGRYDQ